MRLVCLVIGLGILGLQTNTVLADATNELVQAELEKNIAETKKRMETAQENAKELEKSVEKARSNLAALDSAIAKRSAVKEKSSQLLNDYGTRISEAERARKEFQSAIEKDRKELALVRKDLVATKQKLGALQAAEKALEESIQISEESLDKISNSRSRWGANKGEADGELKAVTSDLENLEKQREEAAKALAENNAALAKWRQSHVQSAKTLQELTTKLKSQQRDPK